MANEEIDKELLANVEPLSGTPIYASAFHMQGSGNDFTLIFQNAQPMVDKRSGTVANIAANAAVAIVKVSPQGLKDLYLLIGDQLTQFEKDFGEVVTPFTRARATAKDQK